jgi:hypothetical protein
MLGMSLLPTVSQALEARRSVDPWTQRCSSARPDQVLGRDVALHPEQHCSACGLAVGAIGMPPALAGGLAVSLGSGRAALINEMHRAPDAWRPPQARAPPRG